MRTIPFLFARLQFFGCCKKVKEFLMIGYFAFAKSSHSLQRALCVFMRNGKLKIGKILQFSKLKNKSVSGRQFKESTARISSDIGVVCSWFELMSGSENVFQLCSENDKQNTVHYYIPLSDYVCTLTSKCIQTKDKEGNSNTSIKHIAANQKVMMTTDCLRLTDSCKKYISNAVPKKCFDVGSSSCSGSAIRTTIDKTNLYESDRLALLGKTEYLNDNHMLCALILLKQAFPELDGLESTLRQQKGLTPLPDRPSLQILHINDNHWVVASTIDCPPEANILLYDSLYTTINNQTKLLLAELVHSTKSTFTVGLANVKKQSGSKDCGLFSVAFVTDIAFGTNPSFQIYKQAEMRQHLLKCFEQKKMEPFPIAEKRTLRALNLIFRFVPVKVFCHCRRTDHYGSEMILCEGTCNEWFHIECLASFSSEPWLCANCS